MQLNGKHHIFLNPPFSQINKAKTAMNITEEIEKKLHGL